MSNSFYFTIRVWLTSIVVAPSILILIDSLSLGMTWKDFLIGRLYFILFSIIYGMILSLPSWTILFFVTKIINKQKQLSTWQKKGLLLPIGTVLTIAPFYLLFIMMIGKHKRRHHSNSGFIIQLQYCLGSCFTDYILMQIQSRDTQVNGQFGLVRQTRRQRTAGMRQEQSWTDATKSAAFGLKQAR